MEIVTGEDLVRRSQLFHAKLPGHKFKLQKGVDANPATVPNRIQFEDTVAANARHPAWTGNAAILTPACAADYASASGVALHRESLLMLQTMQSREEGAAPDRCATEARIRQLVANRFIVHRQNPEGTWTIVDQEGRLHTGKAWTEDAVHTPADAALAGLLCVFSPSPTINSGLRFNRGEVMAPGTFMSPCGFVGVPDPILDIPGEADAELLVVTPSRGESTPFQKLWAGLLLGRDALPTWRQAQADPARFVPFPGQDLALVDTDAYRRRLELVLVPMLAVANDLAGQVGRPAFVHCPTFGAQPAEQGSSRFPGQWRVVLEACREAVRQISLPNVADIQIPCRVTDDVCREVFPSDAPTLQRLRALPPQRPIRQFLNILVAGATIPKDRETEIANHCKELRTFSSANYALGFLDRQHQGGQRVELSKMSQAIGLSQEVLEDKREPWVVLAGGPSWGKVVAKAAEVSVVTDIVVWPPGPVAEAKPYVEGIEKVRAVVQSVDQLLVELREIKGGDKKPDVSAMDAAGHHVQVHFSSRGPAALLQNERFPVAGYGWSGASQPGNEYWLGEWSASDSAAMVAASNIGELQNPAINPRLTNRILAYPR